MAKLRTLNSMFTTITKERIELDFTILKAKMEEEKALQIIVIKRPIERLPKPVEALMLTPKVEGQSHSKEEKLEVFRPIGLNLLFGIQFMQQSGSIEVSKNDV
jgi:hypothetical protein